MQTPVFSPKDPFITQLDQAVSKDSDADATGAVRSLLCRSFRDQAITLPPEMIQPLPDRYARRLLYASPELGYSIIAMTWGPGQGTPVHDHSGMWCVEGIWAGALEVVQYEILEHAEERYRFESVGSINAGVGSAGSLIPPHEYHTIRNPDPVDCAVSIHIYSGNMCQCNCFMARRDGWYERVSRRLGLD